MSDSESVVDPPLSTFQPPVAGSPSASSTADRGAMEVDRYRRGLRAYASQIGIPESEVAAHFAQCFGERFGEEAISAAGGAWNDDELTLRDRSMVVVAALATQGGVDERLRGHIRWALEHGVTPAELDAMVALLAVYVGYPRASVAGEIVREELREAAASES